MAIQVRDPVPETDLCDILFVTDRRLRKNMLEDIRIESIIASAKEVAKHPHHDGSYEAPGACQSAGEDDEAEEVWVGADRLEAMRLGSSVDKGIRKQGCQNLPPLE